MLLYIIRHAHAGVRGDPKYPDDGLRPLSKQGRRRFCRLVKKLASIGFAPEFMATSPLTRCRQTAKIVSRRLAKHPDVVELDVLAPGSDLARLIEWSNHERRKSLAWVGHSPDVEEMIAELLGANSESIRMSKGAVAAIEFSSEKINAGAGQLLWLVAPSVLDC